MRFWDSSALVPLCVRERSTKLVRPFANDAEEIVVWWGSRTECVSAFERRLRMGDLSNPGMAQARRRLRALSDEWSEVTPSEALRELTERLLSAHDLGAADAFQLAAGLVWASGDLGDRAFVSFDQKLRSAASREGFRVLPD